MKKAYFIGILFFASLQLMAVPITPERATSVAMQFLSTIQPAAQAPALAAPPEVVATYPMPKSGNPAFYVVSVDGGFVLVSADDEAYPVSGYSSGKWPTDEPVPAHVRAFLDDLAGQMETGLSASGSHRNPGLRRKPNTSLAPAVTTTLPDSVEPLIQTTWYQKQYYNDLCPENPNGYNGHVVTGCVATAISQIIKYWGYPQHGHGSHTYTSKPTYGEQYGPLTVHYDSAPVKFFRRGHLYIRRNGHLYTATGTLLR